MKLNLGDRWRLRRSRHDDVLRGLPVLVLMPHSRCNCRCIMCDIWRANANGRELGAADFAPHVDSLKKLKVRCLVLSGGEALMHSNLWALCRSLEPLHARIVLLSTGLLLKRFADDVAAHCDEVIVSLDGSPAVHDTIRNIPRAFARLADGVAALQRRTPRLPITARCVIQKQNFRDIMNIIDTAETLGLRQVSFLAADVSTESFNRPGGWPQERIDSVALSRDEVEEFEQLLADNRRRLEHGARRGLVAESYPKLAAIAAYYRALNGDGEFPAVHCNAPWVSAVIETDGAVRPCFFHPAFGYLADADFEQTLNSDAAVRFRQTLDVGTNPVCQRCVCSLNL